MYFFSDVKYEKYIGLNRGNKFYGPVFSYRQIGWFKFSVERVEVERYLQVCCSHVMDLAVAFLKRLGCLFFIYFFLIKLISKNVTPDFGKLRVGEASSRSGREFKL